MAKALMGLLLGAIVAVVLYLVLTQVFRLDVNL